jgi:AcrR family transcriptional regulator
MKLREQHKADTRAAVLAAASTLFAEAGFEGCTTRAIAQRAGVGVGTVFLHFADKQAIVEALLCAQIDAALEEAFRTLPPAGPVPKLVHVAAGLWAAYDRRPELARVLVQQSLFLGGRPTTSQLHALRAWVVGRVERAVAAGEVPPVAPELAFFVYFSHYFGLLVRGLRGELPPEARGPVLATCLARFFRVEEA